MYRTLVCFLAPMILFAHAEAYDAAAAASEISEYRAAPELSAQSTDNLYLLGKVWGYLKYHHPRVTAGCFNWDEELLEIADDVALAGSHDETSEILADWVRGLDDQERECGSEETPEVHFAGEDSWLRDGMLLGSALTGEIAAISAQPQRSPAQHYVSLAQVARNPQFQHEDPYSDVEHLDWRYRLIALFRFWNIVEYWSPYKDLIDADWDEVLKTSIPRFVSAEEEEQYVLELMELIARVQDGHSNLWSAGMERPPAGVHVVPVHLRSVEGRPVVWRVSAAEDENGLVFGDVIVAVDDVPVDQLVDAWSPYYGVSNRSALLRETYRALLRGPEGAVDVRVERDGEQLNLQLEREPFVYRGQRTHDRDGDTFQMLSDDVAYLKLSSVSQQSVPDYLTAIAECRGLIVDIRNYPSDFVVFALGQHFVDEVTPFARFTHGDLEAPGTFVWSDPIELSPVEPFFDGKVVILVDESSQSQAEYTAMAFRAGSNAIVIGSQTAGADGNVSSIPLPGDHRTMISGIGVFYPDKSPTQQIGIVPDIVAMPTIAGLRAGRDEVLERAVAEIMQDDIDQAALLEMTRIPHAPTSPSADVERR